jgi:TPR repeat protein
MKHFIGAAVLAVLPLAVSAQDLKKGLEAYDVGDFQTALIYFKDIAAGPPYEYEDSISINGFTQVIPVGQVRHYLGLIHEHGGHGVLQDYAEAIKWYRLAAEQGKASAQVNLGLMYQGGLGLLQSNVMAHMWFNIASANGHNNAGEWRDERAGLMTSADISKAQEMAGECMNSNYKDCGY